MHRAGFFLILIFMLVACGSGDNSLPTQLNLPASTKTLIPTQAQSLTTPTLSDRVEAVDTATDVTNAQSADTQATANPVTNSPTDTPVNCDVQDEWFEYTVQRGDNLASIANRTGSTIDELTVANCLENPNRLRSGQLLYVPNDIAPSSTPLPTSAGATSVPLQTTSAPVDRTPIVSASLKKTYKNEKGFAFDYPLDWFVTESQTSTVENILITSFEYTAGVEIPQNRWTDEMVSITLTVFEASTTQSLSDWTQTVSQQFQNAANVNEVFLPETVITDDGLQGQLIDYVTNDDTIVRNYYFIINGHQVQVNVGGNVELAIPIVESLMIPE